MRGHFAVGFRQGGRNHEKHEKHERDNNRTTNGHEWTRISSIHEAVTLFLYIFVFFVCFVLFVV